MKQIKISSSALLFELRGWTIQLERSMRALSTGRRDSLKENLPSVEPFRYPSFPFIPLQEQYSFARNLTDAYISVAFSVQNILLRVRSDIERYIVEGDEALITSARELVDTARSLLRKTTFKGIAVGLGLKQITFLSGVENIDLGAFDPVSLGLEGRVFRVSSVSVNADFVSIVIEDEFGNRVEDTAKVEDGKAVFSKSGISLRTVAERFSFSFRLTDVSVLSPWQERSGIFLEPLSKFIPSVPDELDTEQAKKFLERLDIAIAQISEIVVRAGEFVKKISDFADILSLNMLKLKQIESFASDVNFDEEAVVLNTARIAQEGALSVLARSVAISSETVRLLVG